MIPRRRSSRRASEQIMYDESSDQENEPEEDDQNNLPSSSPEKPNLQQTPRRENTRKRGPTVIQTLAEEEPAKGSDESDEDEFFSFSSISKRKSDSTMELDFVSSPPAALTKRVRH